MTDESSVVRSTTSLSPSLPGRFSLLITILLLLLTTLQPVNAMGQSTPQGTPSVEDRPPSTYVRPNLGRPVNAGTTIPDPAVGLELRLYTLTIETGASIALPYSQEWTVAGFIGVTEITNAFGVTSDSRRELDTLNFRPAVPGMVIGNTRDQTAVTWVFGVGPATDPDLATPSGVTLRRIGQLPIPESMAGQTVATPLVVQAAGLVPQPLVNQQRGGIDTRTYDDATSVGLISVLSGEVSLTDAEGQISTPVNRNQATAFAASGISVIGEARTAAEELNLYVSLLIRPYSQTTSAVPALPAGTPRATPAGGVSLVVVPTGTTVASPPALRSPTAIPATPVTQLPALFAPATPTDGTSPEARREIPCDLAPITPERVESIIADLQADPVRASALFSDPFSRSARVIAGTGQPVDAETLAGLNAALDILSVCGQTGDFARALAALSPDYLAFAVASIFGVEDLATFTEALPPSSAVPEARVLVGMEIFPDSRVGALVYTAFGASYVTFVQNDVGVWQVDSDDPTIDLTGEDLAI